MTRRGFALPLAVLLAFVAGVMTLLLLERQSAQARTAQRELDGYTSRHFERGVREVISQWADTIVGQPLADVTQEDGHALDIECGDGTLVSVYLFDGQGPALSDPAGLDATYREDALALLTALGEATGWNPDPAWLRPAGAAAVSAGTAAPEVLTAAAVAAGSGDARAFTQAVLASRADGVIKDSDLETAKNRANLDTQGRERLSRLVTSRPTLLAVVIDVYPPGAGEPSLRYGARLESSGSSNRSGGLLLGLAKFLTWEELPIRDEQGPASPQ